MKKTIFSTLIIITLPFLNQSSFATTGYFMHGYGVKAQGNAGTAIAQFNDSLTIANNPAGLSWVGTRLDTGLTLFSPDRSAEIQGNLAGANGNYDGNAREYFLLPEFGFNKKINDTVDLGIAIYGNGGMNTGYDHNPFTAFGNTGKAGVNITQVFISPAVAWRFSENQSIGIATNILYQEFEAKGLSAFGAFSSTPNHISNQGKDSSTGIGIKLGWAGQISDRLSLGATYSSKIKADKFGQYKGLFADSGNFDVPENYGIGANFQFTPKLNLAADISRINFSDIDSVGNSFDINSLFSGNGFGSKQGPGFGWKDINIYRLGLGYQASSKLSLRAGYSHNDQPINKDQTFLNILAPAVIQDHISIGGTWNIDPSQEINFAYTYGIKKTVHGQQSIPVAFGGGEANIEMSQHLFGLAYGRKF
ncbi:OmpP1/FadL family transporter [Acinetobacter puyangensis]|uniref:Long-chain fatty acid transport protein n=1 Tax=Acinetobacter puyangensis TaxID=1096779 RepID=A0A240E3J3_9GAMM|nr:outer membrane protein transport protein [Acinetobacter puyangensis]SNX43344.1 long-chain fatty acid transport protein [Acinetobacter puyangensis]